MYLLGGMTVVFFGAIMPELLSHYHTTYTSGGLLALLGAIGFIGGVPLTAACMKKFHYRMILSGSAIAVAVAQIGVMSLPPLVMIGVLVMINGLGAAALETAVASYVMEQFPGRRAIFMSRLEVAFGIGSLGMPAIASVLIALHQWRFSALAIGVFAIFLAAFWQTVSVSLDAPQAANEDEKMDAKTADPPVFRGSTAKYGVLALFLLMILIYVGFEGSLNNFLPSIFTIYLKTRPYLGSLSSSAFWGAMVCGRMLIGWIARRVSYERYLFGSIIMGAVFFLILTVSHVPLISFATIFGLGFSMSAVYSITMVYANHTFPGMERTVTSAVTAASGVGAAVFPAIIGYAMDHLMPQQVLWTILCFIALLLISFLLIFFTLATLRKPRTVNQV